ncbi:MAG: alkaline shock response membrane anchor protein AmaP [Bacillota bacterium]
MRALDRFLLAVYSFIVGLGMVILALYSLGWNLPAFLLEESMGSSNFRYAMFVLAVILFLLSVRFLISVFERRVIPHILIKDNPLGQVHISVEAITGLVSRTAFQLPGVRDCRAQLAMTPAGLQILIRLTVSGELNLPELLTSLQEEIKQRLAQVVGLEVNQIRILVTSLQPETTTSSGKVR